MSPVEAGSALWRVLFLHTWKFTAGMSTARRRGIKPYTACLDWELCHCVYRSQHCRNVLRMHNFILHPITFVRGTVIFLHLSRQNQHVWGQIVHMNGQCRISQKCSNENAAVRSLSKLQTGQSPGQWNRHKFSLISQHWNRKIIKDILYLDFN